MKKLQSLLMVVPMLMLLTGACSTIPAPSTLPPNAVNITDPVKAEDAFFAVLKHTRNQLAKLPAGSMETEENAFKAAARETYDAIESWQAGHGDSAYRIAWAKMLATAVPIEIAARGK